MPHLFMLLSPSKAFDTTSMLTCRPSPYVSEMSTLSACSASLIFSRMLSTSSVDILCWSGDTGGDGVLPCGPLTCRMNAPSSAPS